MSNALRRFSYLLAWSCKSSSAIPVRYCLWWISQLIQYILYIFAAKRTLIDHNIPSQHLFYFPKSHNVLQYGCRSHNLSCWTGTEFLNTRRFYSLCWWLIWSGSLVCAKWKLRHWDFSLEKYDNLSCFWPSLRVWMHAPQSQHHQAFHFLPIKIRTQCLISCFKHVSSKVQLPNPLV